MKKSLVALAIAGAFSGAAFAQSSVSLYGIIDGGYQYNDYDRSGAVSGGGIESGIRNGSRWGLRGSEDLGGGLKAIFQLENGYSHDTGTLGQGGRMWGRQGFVGFDSPYGMLALGRFAMIGSGTGSVDIFSAIDPFYTGYGMAALGSTFTEAGSVRVDNAVYYRTPKWQGLQGSWMHSFNTNGAETGAPSNNQRMDDFGVSYGWGPLYAAVTYSITRFPDASDFDDEKLLQIGATYDLKFVKLHAAFADEKAPRSAFASAVGNTADGVDAQAWMVGATIPFGGGDSAFKLSYQDRNGDSKTIGADHFNADRTVYNIGYEYFLSKRTIAWIYSSFSDGDKTLQKGTAATDFANRNQYAIGMTHFF